MSREALDIELSPEHQQARRMLEDVYDYAEAHGLTMIAAIGQPDEGRISVSTTLVGHKLVAWECMKDLADRLERGEE